ncbi:MAG: NAD(P)-dependent methylenetetrahydromethanopterin dehydrogenase [Candidatus Jordarchaeaceae archaeon]
MEVLELEPLKGQKLRIVMVESEHGIDWYLLEPSNSPKDFFSELRIMSKEYREFINKMVEEYRPDFCLEERGMRSIEEFLYDNPLVDVFKKHGIPYSYVDIADNARDYIWSTISRKQELRNALIEQITKILAKNPEARKNDENFLKLVTWAQYFEQNLKEIEEDIKFRVREAWMMSGVLNQAREIKKKNVTAMLICDPRHADGISKLCTDLDVDLVTVKAKKEIHNKEETAELSSLLESSHVEIIPIVVKKKEQRQHILYFLDTDQHASPFDMNMAYDAGFDVVIPLGGVKPDEAQRLVQDIIFSRGPKGAKYTAIFVGGSNVNQAQEIFERAVKSLVPPFEVPIIFDPRGACTTASALVAKAEEAVGTLNLGNIEKMKVVALGGTGPVGRFACILAAKLGCKVYMVETWSGASEQYVKTVAKDLNEKFGVEIKGVFAPNKEQIMEIVHDADIVFSVAKAGVQLLSKEDVEGLKPKKLLLDVNAVPPLGIGGLDRNDDKKELKPGVYGVGSLAIGALKRQVEENLLRKAKEVKGKAVFDHLAAFETAREILLEKPVISKAA